MIFAGLLFGFILIFQLFNLTTTSLWHDEAFSALLIQYEDYGEMIRRIGLDVHPPLYYILLRFWTGIFNTSLFSLRAFSLLFGIGTALGIFFLTKEIFRNSTLAFLSAVLLSLVSFQVQYNLEARMYTLGAFFLVFATFFVLHALKTRVPSTSFFMFMAAYVTCASAALYTHYYTVFGIFAHGLFILYALRFRLKQLALFAGAFLAIALLFLPWLPTFLRQLSQVQTSYWIPPITKWSIATTISKMTIGDGLDPNQAAFLIILVNILALGAFFFMLSRYSQKERWILLFLFLAPFLGSLLLSLKTSIYLDRYFIFYLPYLIIALAAAIFAIPQKQTRFILLTFILIGAVLSYPLHAWTWRLSEKPGMEGATSYLLPSLQKEDEILINSSFVYFTFLYYNESDVHPLLYAPDELPHFSGTALLNRQDITRSFDIAEAGDTIWTIDTTGFGNFQPTVPVSWQKQEEKEFPDAYNHRGSIIVRKYLVQDK